MTDYTKLFNELKASAKRQGQRENLDPIALLSTLLELKARLKNYPPLTIEKVNALYDSLPKGSEHRKTFSQIILKGNLHYVESTLARLIMMGE